ncbi:Imm1 family immunity protein [Micromonospora sp. C28SCA-DRY-2]|uniref:Imm1 family immunity protein n=1 Tax=Micromonospora sp. C28SCA-DRY-2 TaxID=3059522 RepID=UPI0026750D7D|nr:Imm1 family immunity protein [Micromonospora sp. C28SCA-DRY-2]MDO3701783.1 Imm1 family immunity protein [Micromonospora sp. C28SCA-DRY-2]
MVETSSGQPQHSAEDRIEAARRVGATSLDLSRLSLAALPESLAGLPGLTELLLVGNNLTELPDWLGDLTALTRLGLGFNQLTAVPESLGNLTSLTWLGLSGNQLRALPESLSRLTALTWLDLSHNQLSELPRWVGELTFLTRLDLTENRLTVLPESLGELTALARLELTGNQLTALPESLGGLTALTRLDLAGNQLTGLPEWLRDPTAGRSVNAPLHAWIDGTQSVVAGPADLDALLDGSPAGGVTLVSEDGVRSLHITLQGDSSALVWEDEEEIMLSWGPVPPGAPPGQTAGDAEYAYADPWFTTDDAEPFELTEEEARRAGHGFLRTGRRPVNVQWVDKP